MKPVLTHDRVHIIRTADKPDRHFERLWRIHARVIRRARIGETWREHEKAFDVAVADLRAKAPWNTDWHQGRRGEAVRADNGTVSHEL